MFEDRFHVNLQIVAEFAQTMYAVRTCLPRLPFDRRQSISRLS
jgi:hypothetical protein